MNTKELTRERTNITLRVDKVNYENFKIIMKDLKLNVSEWLDEMMSRVVEVGIYGGEIVFGITDKKTAYAKLELNKSKEKKSK